MAALAIEAVAGYPNALFRAIGHPVTWMGAWLAALDRTCNRPEASGGMRRAGGVLALVLLLGATAAVAGGVTLLAPSGLVGFLILALLAASLPAQRSLHDHVRAVEVALEQEGLEAGRRAVAMIVGRNPATLDRAAVARAAIESLAENFADGVVAPAFWTALGGLPGGALYKAANTADSMIGHLTPQYAAFGWAAARFDDLVNWPAARLAALWLVLAAVVQRADWRSAVAAVRRDARRHRSPNAGWPEAAMAGALGLRLGGPRVYGDIPIDDAYMGSGRADAAPSDIHRALRLYRAACALQGAALLAVAAVASL